MRTSNPLFQSILHQVLYEIVNRNELLCFSCNGNGKTHLAQAIGLEACKQDKVVRFFRTAALVNRLSEAQKKSELNAFMKTLMKADLIICDEWGYVPLDRDGSKLLFQVISECYEQRSVIITTNLEFSKWVHIFYDEQMTSAMIDPPCSPQSFVVVRRSEF